MSYQEKKIIAGLVSGIFHIVFAASVKAGYVIAGIGFVAGLVLLVLEAAPAVMLNVLFISCSLGLVAEGLLGLRYYRKGLAHA